MWHGLMLLGFARRTILAHVFHLPRSQRTSRVGALDGLPLLLEVRTWRRWHRTIDQRTFLRRGRPLLFEVCTTAVERLTLFRRIPLRRHRLSSRGRHLFDATHRAGLIDFSAGGRNWLGRYVLLPGPAYG